MNTHRRGENIPTKLRPCNRNAREVKARGSLQRHTHLDGSQLRNVTRPRRRDTPATSESMASRDSLLAPSTHFMTPTRCRCTASHTSSSGMSGEEPSVRSAFFALSAPWGKPGKQGKQAGARQIIVRGRNKLAYVAQESRGMVNQTNREVRPGLSVSAVNQHTNNTFLCELGEETV